MVRSARATWSCHPRSTPKRLQRSTFAALEVIQPRLDPQSPKSRSVHWNLHGITRDTVLNLPSCPATLHSDEMKKTPQLPTTRWANTSRVTPAVKMRNTTAQLCTTLITHNHHVRNLCLSDPATHFKRSETDHEQPNIGGSGVEMDYQSFESGPSQGNRHHYVIGNQKPILTSQSLNESPAIQYERQAMPQLRPETPTGEPPVYDQMSMDPVDTFILFLAEEFFKYVGPSFPFLREAIFMRSLKHKQVNCLLVDAVCAVSARFSTEGRESWARHT